MHKGKCTNCGRQPVWVNLVYTRKNWSNKLVSGNWCADCFDREGPLRGRPRTKRSATPEDDMSPGQANAFKVLEG